MSTIAVNAITDASGGNTASINGATPTTDNTMGRNRVINGDMRIDARNAGASVTPSSGSSYTLDRWKNYNSQASKLSFQQNAGSVTPPAGFVNYLGATSLSAYSVGSSDEFDLYQLIEGLNVADLGWGTANAKTVTLSFWVRSSLTGTFGGSIQNSGGSRNYPFSYTISAANTWEQKSITIAGDTSGTWLTTNGVGISLLFSLGAGSSLVGTAGSWTGTGAVGVTGQVNMVGTNGATFYITGVQLEAGSVATSFERVDYSEMLRRCQRYCYIIPAGSYYNFVAQAYSATNAQGYLVFPVTMRSAPTLINPTLTGATTYSPGGSTLSITALIAIGGSSVNAAFFDITVASGFTAGNASLVYTTPSGGITVLSAEL